MIRLLRAAAAFAAIFALISVNADAARRPRHHKPAVSAVGPQKTRKQAPIGGVSGQGAVVPPAALRAAWTQYGPGGLLEARAVVEGDGCPEIAVDLRRFVMEKRVGRDAGFLTLCRAVVPSGSKLAAIVLYEPTDSPSSLPSEQATGIALLSKETGVTVPDARTPDAKWHAWLSELEPTGKYRLVPLAVPADDPQRILVFGDTGCRIKGASLQDCSDPEAWPLARIAAAAARVKPDLVIHVGDYLYRENACPVTFKGCAGTPYGDNWPTWDADFFSPAKPLLAAAPWVIVRGNHEDCQRAGPGFLRLLGPTAFDPSSPCVDHLPSYEIPLARLTLSVMDNADAPETRIVENAVPVYRTEIEGLANSRAPVWWLLHRPIWAPITGPLGIPVGGNQTMIAATGDRGIPAPVELMLSGHIHTFQAINYTSKPHVPPQIVAGFGGDMLDPTPADLRGTIFQGDSGVHVKDGLSIGGFGFLLMTRMEDGWAIDVYDPHGRIERQCTFRAGELACPVRR